MKSPKTVFYSILGLACIVLTFTIHWLFIIPAAILSWAGWKILMKNN